ncbi:protein NETWORKED 2A [Cannabis sativa]|uniref:protein NETWORKED 2A n=1 Tax=Cannabis sativa TaxID=3483 RepID=UPI0011DFD843|nr:protein NETWORKED 2A [Cannabis sativa]
MLQRAASNAYSWWWASHVRTKQSKWLEENLQDMEEKVTMTLKIIDAGGDSFAQRAEMYYRKRPELINFVEEIFRAYRALAERYDLLSRDLQSANRTIATIYPERAHELAMDVDEEQKPSQTSTSKADQSEPSVPKVPKIPMAKDFRRPSMAISRKETQLGRISSSVKVVPSSGLNRTEALEEIDNLQKDILRFQTEKEFVKSMYENGYQKFWEIENEITEMQKKVSSLQDEFDIQTVIEDDEARSIMAATALKSCQETLVKLQEKQEKSTEEALVEQQRIKDAQEKFSRIRAKFLGKVETKVEDEEEIVGMGKDENDLKMLREMIMKKLNVDSKATLTVTELAEKIDEVVNKVVSLETEVTSQTALVKRLGSETDQLQENVRSLENENENLKEGSNKLRMKLRELEEELKRIKALNRSLKLQNSNLQTHFTEASCNIDHLSEKLKSVKQDEEVDEHKQGISIEEVEVEKNEEEKEDDSSVLGNSAESQTNPSNSSDTVSVEVEEEKQEVGEEQKELVDEPSDVLDVEKESDEAGNSARSNWRLLFLKGLEDRENILLQEYTSVLQDYKEVKKKLSEMESKNRESIFDLAIQIRELKSDVASKDDEIKSLKHKFDYPPQMTPDGSPFTYNTDYKYQASQDASGESANQTPFLNLDLESDSGELGVQTVKTLEKLMSATEDLKTSNENEVVEETVEKNQAPVPHSVSSVEDKFRSDIDGLLEENLEFWLRFSTSVHQIQKFETSIEDLQLDLSKLREKNNKKPEGIIGSKQHYIQTDARPIYRHLREIQTEMALWLEHNAVLQDELQGRFSSLCKIQDEISRISRVDSEVQKTKLSKYQAAKFQGEVLNMKQENNKVADELKLGLNRVKGLKVEVEKTLRKLNEDLGISTAKNVHCSPAKHPANRPRIPLRSFLFGVKLKRQKASIFSCVSPLQKQYSDLAIAGPPPI